MTEHRSASQTQYNPVSPAYKNSALPIADRVADLLNRITFAEKVAQMQYIWREIRLTQFTENDSSDFSALNQALPHGNSHPVRINDRNGVQSKGQTAASISN
ncbi:hypothetical protein JW960_21225 [candidate division KSB1 bacterium]|nr:hypothetical protein [candidate division KSB1 bacterium]